MLSDEVQKRIENARVSNILDLSNFYYLEQIPNEVFSLVELKELVIKNCNLKKIPDQINQLKNLEILDIEDHDFNDLPFELFELIELTELSLKAKKHESDGLTSLPDNIQNLKNLVKLNLGNNSLSRLPSTFDQLTNLEELCLDNNQFEELPLAIRKLPRLHDLFFANNKMQGLPDWIWDLKQLKGLYLQDNKIKEIPELKENSHLEALNLNDNSLEDLPDSFLRYLKKLDILDVGGNAKLQELLGEKVTKSTNPHVIFRNLKKEYESKTIGPLLQAKILVLGDGAVGKTSLIKRLLGEQYDAGEPTTKGVQIKEWMPGLNVSDENQNEAGLNQFAKFRIWDFAGQAISHATHQLFLTEDSICIVVVNGRQEKQDIRLIYWLNVIRSFVGKKASVIVVINGVDQNRLYLDQKELKETYRIHDFIETSAETEKGIDQLTREILNIAENKIPHFPKKVKLSWKSVLNDFQIIMEESNIDHNFMGDFYKICEDRKITDEGDQKEILSIMHKVGVTFNYKANDEEWIILEPNRITKNIYRFQSYAKTTKAQEDDGFIDELELEEILHDLRINKPEWELLEALMIENDLCHKSEQWGLTFTRLLPVKMPKIDMPAHEETLSFVYQYNFLPESILHRFIGALLKLDWLNNSQTDETKPSIWRHGIYLTRLGQHLLSKIDPYANQVHIVISGGELTERQSLLRQGQHIMQRVHNQVAYLEVSEFISIPNQNGLRDILLVPYDHLLWLHLENQKEFFPYGGSGKLEVKKLLNDIITEEKLDQRVHFLTQFHEYFNISELEGICFAMGIEYEDIPGHQISKDKFSRELFTYVERRGRLQELVEICRELRSTIDPVIFE